MSTIIGRKQEIKELNTLYNSAFYSVMQVCLL